MMSKTNENLLKAAQGEAFARLKYMAFAQKALEEGYPEIAQLFEEAAGAETVHGITHLQAMGFVKSTLENLQDAVYGEQDEIDEMYPSMIAEAESENPKNKDTALKAFKVAMAREKAHKRMFKRALRKLQKQLDAK
ncbi:MAG: rubrerythrin [Candidatus Dojkabacteria bacterium]|nr:MAG: rubrerythrin [Candidatus Dojkabacteria bacterium]